MGQDQSWWSPEKKKYLDLSHIFSFYNTLKRYIELLCKKNRLGDLLLGPQITRGKKGGRTLTKAVRTCGF